MRGWLRLAFLTIAMIGAADAAAQQSQDCFVGRDLQGAPAQMVLQAERYGDFFEVFGRIASTNIGAMQIKADGWSGAGRMFRRHEFEGDAMFIQISDYTAFGLVLHVDGFGSFPFRTVAC